MAASNKITGKLYVRVNGNMLPMTGDANLDPGGVTREAVVLNDGSIKYREEYKEASVECTVVHDGTISLKEIQAITDATITVESDAGQQFVMTGAFCTEPPKMNSKGEIEAKFAGNEIEETTSGSAS